MSSDVYVIGFLSLIILFQNVYYSVVIHRLINKLMSRNYGEYEASKPVKESVKVKLDKNPQEDLSYLNNLDPRLAGMR